MVDMENQVKANNIRIQLLESQNNGLRNSIHKLQSMQQPQLSNQQEDEDDKWATYVQVYLLMPEKKCQVCSSSTGQK